MSAMTPRVRLWDIVALMIGAFIAEIVVGLPLLALTAPRFWAVDCAVMAGGIWWIVGYQKMSRTRGYDSLQQRFALWVQGSSWPERWADFYWCFWA